MLLAVGGSAEAEAEDEEERTQLRGFSRQRWTPERDIHAFASILFHILVGRSAASETVIPPGIPDFISKIIEDSLWSRSGRRYSFYKIFEILRKNEFRIEESVDSADF
jgi:hypothetical protein